jgi:hypothetical protein
MTNPKRLLVLLAAAVMLAVGMGTVLAQEAEDEMEAVFSGTAVISNSDEDTINDSITYELANVGPLAAGTAYEGWLVSDDGKIKMSTGVMEVSEDGSISHTYTSPTGDDLIGTFSVVVITVEPVPDDDPTPSGVLAYSAVIPISIMGHIRTLTSDEGLVSDLTTALETALAPASMARDGFGEDDLDATKQSVQDSLDNLPAILDAVTAVTDEASMAANRAPDSETMAAHSASLMEQANGITTRVNNAKTTGDRLLETDNVELIDRVLLGPGAGLTDSGSLITNLEASINGSDAVGSTFEGASGVVWQAQLMATFVLQPGGPPYTISVGDEAVPLLAQLALIASAILLVGGGLLVIRGRAKARS